MKKLIFFDVDGVLVNSINEILLTSWNEFNLWKQSLGLPFEPFATDMSAIPAEFISARTVYGKKSNKGYHRVAINPLILAGFSPDAISANLIHQLSEADPLQKQQTMRRLEVVRQKLLASTPIETLVSLYADVDYDWLQQKIQQQELYLITNNPFSVQGLIAHGIKINPCQIRGPRGDTHHKSDHINEICQQRKIPVENCLFVDDSPASLQEVAQGTKLLSSRILQNSWGDKPSLDGFACLSWTKIMDTYHAI